MRMEAPEGSKNGELERRHISMGIMPIYLVDTMTY